jgi:thiamine-phosphate pyrophosphorylase
LCRTKGIDPVALAGACAGAGARWLQLRAKAERGEDFLKLADAVVAAAAGARVIINDRADIAAMSRAAGVHVGQEDLQVEHARAIVGAGAIVGVSTHDEDQLAQALAGSATYVAVGPIFRTATKDTGYDPRGLALIRAAAGRGKPIVAIGGITLETAAAAIAAGAASVAVISDLLAADPADRVRQYLRVLA